MKSQTEKLTNVIPERELDQNRFLSQAIGYQMIAILSDDFHQFVFFVRMF